MILAAKIATLLAWALIIFNWICPIAGWYNVIHWTGVGFIAAHTLETVIYFPAAKRVGGNLALHIVQLFVFGYAHNMVLIVAEKNKAQ